MIITKISRLGTYVGVNPHFATLIDFLEKTGLENLTEGSIAIDGNRLFGNCFTYLADGQAGAFFETHQKYLDIHLVLENEEAMAVTSPENVSVTQEYDEEKDIEPQLFTPNLKTIQNPCLSLDPGWFLFSPNGCFLLDKKEFPLYGISVEKNTKRK
ncbi:TPA: YhcH/YjgK/YiaL family protein, partial [Streptococcus pneumoniae]